MGCSQHQNFPIYTIITGLSLIWVYQQKPDKKWGPDPKSKDIMKIENEREILMNLLKFPSFVGAEAERRSDE